MDANLLKKLTVAWVLGFVFALVLVERWRQLGMRAAEATVPAALGERSTQDGETQDGQTKASRFARVREIGAHAGQAVATGISTDLARIQRSVDRSSRQVERVVLHQETASDAP